MNRDRAPTMPAHYTVDALQPGRILSAPYYGPNLDDAASTSAATASAPVGTTYRLMLITDLTETGCNCLPLFTNAHPAPQPVSLSSHHDTVWIIDSASRCTIPADVPTWKVFAAASVPTAGGMFVHPSVTCSVDLAEIVISFGKLGVQDAKRIGRFLWTWENGRWCNEAEQRMRMGRLRELEAEAILAAAHGVEDAEFWTSLEQSISRAS